jgi:transcriptional regulator with XRE-family HTH domain
MLEDDHFSRKKELGYFLRSRREKMEPNEGLLEKHPRRRTPGLRREEIAEEAGIGVSWYTWIEQGRDINISPDMLGRVTRALKLNRDEVVHAFRLAGVGLPEAASPVPNSIRPSLQRVLDAMEYIPAYVHNARWDRIAWNDASLALMGDFSKDSVEERNTVWRTFLNPEVRRYTEDWERLARIVIAEFHASLGLQFEDPWLKQFVDRLSSRSDAFQQLWAEREVIPRQEEKTRIHHKETGWLHLERSIFEIPYEQSLSLIVFTPLETNDTPRRMRELVENFRGDRIDHDR